MTFAAADDAGRARGRATLRQLGEEIAPVVIEDAPRYAWRGVMLDVARHFFGVDDVMRLIDLAALYKLNVLHLHLTDDQGWRIAIDSWPELTAAGRAGDFSTVTTTRGSSRTPPRTRSSWCRRSTCPGM